MQSYFGTTTNLPVPNIIDFDHRSMYEVHFYSGSLVAHVCKGQLSLSKGRMCALTKDDEGSERSWTSNIGLGIC